MAFFREVLVAIRRLTSIPIIALSLMLTACATFSRMDPPNVVRSDQAAPIGFSAAVRFSGLDASAFATLINGSRLRNRAVSEPPGSVLALSGGGAGGAFGAGAIVGLTRSGKRPVFDVVTGVSAGALVAPFAYLGSAWDPQLEETFTGVRSENLLAPYGLASLFTTALYRGAPLRELVNRLVTPQLMDAVAAESKTGRLLLVVTTNMDLGEAVVWNMGAIAATGGEKARTLFQEILVASTSVPGIFPPVMIPVQYDGRLYEEMHADGGATVPFFVVAASPLVAEPNTKSEPVDVFVMVNGPLSAPRQTTELNTIAIAQRGFSALLYQSFRSELLRVATLVEMRGSVFRYTAIPMSYPYAGTLDFDRNEMRQLFSYGETCAMAGELWIETGSIRETTSVESADTCPTTNFPPD